MIPPADDPAVAAILRAASFALGSVIASFLNVVVWRVPRGESISSPPSHCPRCGAAIRWWQNIPVVSYLALRGKCASCGGRISPRYPLVEMLGGLLFLAAYLHWESVAPDGGMVGRFVPLAVWWIWISLMIAGSFIDFDHQLLPDFATVGGMVLGVAWHAFECFAGNGFRPDPANLETYAPLAFSLAGLAVGFGLLWTVRFLGSKAFGREAMGMGDVFLLGAVGALFGPAAAIGTIVLSSVFGSIAGIALVALSKAKFGKFVAIPYGPYICLACLAWMFAGDAICGWYFRFLGFGATP